LLTFLLFSAHAQVVEEKVANVSLAFKLTMDGVLHLQGFVDLFTTLCACAGF
jgi:hypothetical protein